MTQRSLARRANTAQSVVARIENGLVSPSWATLAELIAAADLTLEAAVRPRRPEPTVDRAAVTRLLELSPRERLRASDNGTSSTTAAEPAAILVEAAKRGLQFVLTGDAAARLYGAPRVPVTVELTLLADEENLARLREALAALDARLHVDGIPDGVAVDLSRIRSAAAARWRLQTSAGRVDLHFSTPVSGGYDGLAERAERFWLGDQPLAVASIADLTLEREFADCRSDRDEIEVLRVLASLRV